MNITFNERDEFQRKQIAEKAIQLLRADIDISPMVIDGSWGTGKTEFCHKLINLMAEDETHHLIYVDAFQADHADEPLLTVLAEVINILPSEEAQESFIQKAIPAARYGLKTLAKAGVAHLLRQDAADVVNDFDKEIQQAANKAIDASVESVLKDHVKASESLKALQETLQGIAQEKPIILFVDELDRCRPDFAVNMLEIIKHTFNVEGVQFVLVTNTQQLRSSINHCYGSSIDSQRYLDKFVKFTVNLPAFVSDGYSQTNISLSHYRNLVAQSSSLRNKKLEQNGTIAFIEHIFSIKQTTLREIETFVRHLEIAQTLNESTFAENTIYGYQLLNILAVLLHCFEPSISKDLVNRRLDSKRLIEWFDEKPDSLNDIQTRLHPHQVILHLVCSDSPFNSYYYSPKEEKDINLLAQQVDGFFSRGWGRPDKGESYRVVANTINLLNFLN